MEWPYEGPVQSTPQKARLPIGGTYAITTPTPQANQSGGDNMCTQRDTIPTESSFIRITSIANTHIKDTQVTTHT